jgi:deoxyribodipyrimidine photolyase-related protein
MTRRLVLVLGDQLDPEGPALRDADPRHDVVVMAEVDGEIRRHRNHRQRVVLFLSAMRHLRDTLRGLGFEVLYQQADDPDTAPTLAEALRRAVESRQPESVVATEPGRWHLVSELTDAARAAGVPLTWCPDDHFLVNRDAFAQWAEGRKALTMEHFYRHMRRSLGVLMDGDQPAGGAWNFDRDNRAAFAEAPTPPPPLRVPPDDTTREVLGFVASRYEDLPGTTDSFAWPVTPEDAERVLSDFVEHRLATFGTYQDAMWTGEPFLYHSLLSPALNLKLISPRRVVDAVEEAYRAGAVPINAAEGFVRQVLGWREFVRGVYWWGMPDLATGNALSAERPLPPLFWTGRTDMRCLADVVRQLLDHGYAHHIQRLMVAGLFAQLYGATPWEVHDWFMALYVDSVEWVTLPNVLGMSQYADGGVVGTKPYVASGRYIGRQGNACRACRFDPAVATGEEACPFTTLYWDFLDRHRDRLRGNRRMALQIRNLERKSTMERTAIRTQADAVRAAVAGGAL